MKDESSTSISLERIGFAAQAVGLVLFAATDGNHGRAVAKMAGYLGIQARIYVPKMLDEEAKGKIQGEGAVVVVVEGSYDEAVLEVKKACWEYPNEKGLLISDTSLVIGDEVPGWIVDGYQTMFDEVEEQITELTSGKEITHVLTPVGVGSLTQAVVTHFSRTSRCEKAAIITVEPEQAACLKASLEAGEMVSVDTGHTICTGMCCGTVSVDAWPVLRNGVTAATSVDDQIVEEAIKELQLQGIEAGPCGAATLAGVRQLSRLGALDLGPESVVLILCTEGPRGYSLEAQKSLDI